MPSRSKVLFVCVLLLSAAGALGQGASFGPKPIYLRGSAHAWHLSLDLPADSVFDAAKAVGKRHKLAVVERDDAAGILRLRRGNQKGATLDKHCTFPIVNYYSWKPLENYASAQNTALTRRRPGETLAQAGRLDGTVHLAIRKAAGGGYSVQSICSAFLHDWGLMEATSLGVLESAFLEDLLERLGEPMDVSLPDVQYLEPSRADPTRDLHVAQQCMEKCTPLYRCSGMYVDPESLELKCVAGQ